MIGSGNRISHIFGNIHAEGFKWNRMKQFLDLLSHGWSLPDSRGQGKRAGKVFTVQEKLISSVGGMSHAGAGEVGRHGGRPSRGGGGRCAVGADFSVFRGSRCRLGGGFFAADLRRWAQILEKEEEFLTRRGKSDDTAVVPPGGAMEGAALSAPTFSFSRLIWGERSARILLSRQGVAGGFALEEADVCEDAFRPVAAFGTLF